ncbi:ABC transporter ATP-binding protein [Candidatus Pelagibacter sp.]|jgi:glycerol transport system ATP-binding protein|nr:ABC transporter ATP-binding protein [Candidatus Pelagibacter sp.]MDC3385011.1 ABC transporter ATP-binding protein [Candidatus Pelagibacter sp.]
MSKIDLNNISHSYNPNDPNPVYALNPFSMTWENGKRYAILGPSGCGKTTMLNIVSGLVRPSAGNILFDDKDVTDLKTEDRNIAQVFQFPVIYNTMTVYENLAFPLKCRDFSKDKIDERVKSVADTLSLESFLNSPAKKLTADQKQLISLGRGLVREDVAAVLMDEPLTVIDPDLKFRLRRKLKEINEEFKTTLVYVTHDQNEAMTFADNIIVMSEGEVVQTGTPKDLFERPNTTFVGYFIGSPAMNLFETEVVSQSEVKIGSVKIKTSTDLSKIKNKKIKLGIRSEFIDVIEKEGENTVKAKVKKIEDFGNFKLLTAVAENFIIKSKIDREKPISEGEINLHIPSEKCCVYENEKLI